jgi:hypothetical protein
MTPQPPAALAGRDRTMAADERYQHNSARFWDVDECRWQCATSPGVRYALECRPTVPGQRPEPTGTARRAGSPSGSMQPSTA